MNRPGSWLAALVVGAAAAPARAGSDPAAVAVSGAVQVWERDCAPDGACGLPRALSEKVPETGSIDRPPSPYVLGMHEKTLVLAGLVVDLDVMWGTGDGGVRPKFLGGAVKLRKAAGPAISECSWYDDAPQAVYFPVGACAGYADGGRKQYGVTLYRDPADVD